MIKEGLGGVGEVPDDQEKKYIKVLQDAFDEIEEIVEGKIDIDEDGGPNDFMKINAELDIIRFAVSKIRELRKK